jgi:hypothetical protein
MVTHDWIIIAVGVLNAFVGWGLLHLVRWAGSVDKTLERHARKFERIASSWPIDLTIKD